MRKTSGTWLCNCSFSPDGCVSIRAAGDVVKIARLLFILALFSGLASLASVAKADGVDPVITTSGCGGRNQRPCDAVVLGPGQTMASLSATFTCTDPTNPTTCTASETVVNDTGRAITGFSLLFTAESIPLIFHCAEEGFFACSPDETNSNLFHFTGASICTASLNGDDFSDGVFRPDSDGDEGCGVVITFQGVAGDGTGLNGASVTETFNTPEPSSILLLLFGLMTGLVTLKFFSRVAA